MVHLQYNLSCSCQSKILRRCTVLKVRPSAHTNKTSCSVLYHISDWHEQGTVTSPIPLLWSTVQRRHTATDRAQEIPGSLEFHLSQCPLMYIIIPLPAVLYFKSLICNYFITTKLFETKKIQ